MEELFLKERQLMDEQASYTTLLSLKEETEWLLDLVENRLMGGESSDLESVERLLDATGKTLRLVLEIGQRSHMPWTALQPNLIHIHKTLCLASRNQLPNDQKIESHVIDFEFNGPHLTQLLIQEYRKNNIGLAWPFSVQGGRLHFRWQNGRSQVIHPVKPLTSPSPAQPLLRD